MQKLSRRLFTPSPDQLERIRRENLVDAPVERAPAAYLLCRNISMDCPVDGCARTVEGETMNRIRRSICSHFNYRHPIAIDGTIPPQCSSCDVFGTTRKSKRGRQHLRHPLRLITSPSINWTNLSICVGRSRQRSSCHR